MKKILSPVFYLVIYLILTFSSITNCINSIRISFSYKGDSFPKITNLFNNSLYILEYVLLIVVVVLLILNKAKGKEKFLGILFTLRGILGFVSVGLSVWLVMVFQNGFKSLAISSLLIAILKSVVFIMAGTRIIKENGDVPAKGKFIVLIVIYAILYFTNFTENMKIMGLSSTAFNLFDIISMALLFLGLLHISNALFSEKDVKYASSNSVVAVIVIAIIIFAISGGLGSGGSSGGRGVCKSCGRKFAAGDKGGNFMSVAKRGMCSNCYNNYDSMKEFLD